MRKKNSTRALQIYVHGEKERKNRRKGNREKTVNGRGKIKWHRKENGYGGKYKKENKIQ